MHVHLSKLNTLVLLGLLTRTVFAVVLARFINLSQRNEYTLSFSKIKWNDKNIHLLFLSDYAFMNNILRCFSYIWVHFRRVFYGNTSNFDLLTPRNFLTSEVFLRFS